MQETWVRSLGREDPLEKEMAPHSSTLAWRIPWREEPVGYSPWGHKELDTTERLHFLYLENTETKLESHSKGMTFLFANTLKKISEKGIRAFSVINVRII